MEALIEEHIAHIHYKPVKEKFVLDAFPWQNINALQNETQSDVATIHSELSLMDTNRNN